MLKSAGYDQLIIRGPPRSPCNIWIDNDRVEIRAAKHLRGKSNMETNESLIETHGSRENRDPSRSAAAGEKKVRLACIFSDGIMGPLPDGDAAASWASKNLRPWRPAVPGMWGLPKSKRLGKLSGLFTGHRVDPTFLRHQVRHCGSCYHG